MSRCTYAGADVAKIPQVRPHRICPTSSTSAEVAKKSTKMNQLRKNKPASTTFL